MRPLVVAAAALALLPLLAPTAPALGTLLVEGAGQRGAWAFDISVSATGLGEVVLLNPSTGTVCVYHSFTTFQVFGPGYVAFRSRGTCVATVNGAPQTFPSHNVFGVHDRATPSLGLDTFDVNLASGTGITVPGGYVERGELVVRA